MAKELDITRGILGDIRPNPSARDHQGGDVGSVEDEHRPGSRDVTDGTTGGVGTKVGGTRNYRQGAGATGGDVGNRPE